MKKNLSWMYAAILVCSMALTSCEGFVNAVLGVEDNPVETTVQKEPTIEEWLAQIPGVSDVEIRKTTVTELTPTQQTYYYFFFDQLVDHTDASKGKFKQRVVLRYKDADAVNVLHTQGYATWENPDTLTMMMPRLANILEGNMIEVEYRYFGHSLPEPFENLEFNYLRSSQASEDYHAIVQALKGSGRFKGQWLSTGTSKSGIATALYAYYSSKKGYSDIDLYVPFCAPFCEAVDDSRIGKYMTERCTKDADMQKLPDLDRAIVGNTELSNYLISEYKKTWAPRPDDDILAYYANSSRVTLFDKMASLHINDYKDYIPNPTDVTKFAYTKFFIERSAMEVMMYIDLYLKSGTRALTEAEMLNLRKADPGWAYYIQAMLELGHFRLTFDDLETYCKGTTVDKIKAVNEEGMVFKQYPTYAARFSNAMTKDFIENFLPSTTMPMIFVYGENDPWTGCAIPDPTNSKVQKIIVPKGIHNDYINMENLYPKETRQQIMDAIYKYIKVKK